MAIKSVDQISIVDVTDAYSVILTSETHAFLGSTNAAKAGTTTTQIIPMQGSTQVPCSVTVSEITKPAGVTVSSDSNTTSPTLTISVTTSVTAGGVIKIPVHVGDVTITKEFTFTIAFTGATGSKGDTGSPGADAITLSITSSNGTIFKNSAIETVLTAHVYRAGAELNTSQITALGTIKWYKDGAETAVGTGATLTIDAGDVSHKASYVAQLEG